VTVVFITGASSGFGYEMSLEFARRGSTVFASMREIAKGVKLQEAASSERLDVRVIQLDVTDDGSVQRCVEKVFAEVGAVDILVNNAGVGGGGAVESTPDAVYRRVFETNVFGVLRMLRAVLPIMRQAGHGVIVQTSSLSGVIPNPFTGAYGASKHALEALSESLRYEVEPFGIRVVIVEPGAFQTELVRNSSSTRVINFALPYADVERRMSERASNVMKSALPASIAAAAIVDAALDNSDRFRYLIGEHAEAAAAARSSLSEEGWASRIRTALRGEGPMGSA
jgi:NAD(P)-dependent dehydrogenase (short-subunit alcohol dehydrogenase family)